MAAGGEEAPGVCEATVTPASPHCTKEWMGVCINLGLGLCQMRTGTGGGVWVLRSVCRDDGNDTWPEEKVQEAGGYL